MLEYVIQELVDKTTGLIKNAHNSQWLNNKNLIKDLKRENR